MNPNTLGDVHRIVYKAGYRFAILPHSGVVRVHIIPKTGGAAICRSNRRAGLMIADADLDANCDRIVCHNCLVAMRKAGERKIEAAMKLSR